MEKEVTSQFIQKAPVELKELQQAVYRKDFRSVLQTAEQLQVWLHLFLLENLSQTLTSIEDQARKKEFTAETADNLDILHCNIEEIIKEL
ncbi:hypothetical protein [Flavobacterium johnsoniae]|uniref:hypothetical protein n=1 Tax=Flavobacterium johnsoniae TaxID=986 RepID=UPI00223B84CC|nr:hypothetical protein [Flavobacterium johnsoniae]